MAASPRIAILTPYTLSEFPGGTEVFNEQLARVLPGVQIFAEPRSSREAASRWNLDSIGLEQPRRAWEVARRFYGEHRRNPFQLAICDGLYGWPLSVLPPGIPVIQVYHFTFAGLARKGIAEPGVRFHMRFVDGAFDRYSGTGKHVVAVGRNVLDEVQKYYRHEGRVIPNGVDTRMFTKQDRLACRDQLGLPKHARIAIFVGRPEFTKGFDILRAVVHSSPDTLFLLVGGSPSLGPNSVAYPRVPHAQMPMYYSAADFLLLPSRYEGFNLTILEALACDLPILVSRAAYPLDEPWQELGVVVDSQDPEGYLEAMKELPAVSQGVSGRERVLARYSLERFAENWRAEVFTRAGVDW